jgi:hypothetical protein
MSDNSLQLREELLRHGNNHSSSTHAWEAFPDRIDWHQPAPSDCWLVPARTVSVVIPAHQVGYSLPTVLDALDAQHHQSEFEVIVVDDASTDDTAHVAARHQVVDRLVRLPQRMGAATARNVGTALAGGQTVLYLDGDMVIPPHVITDVAARATDTSVLVGFRHNLRHEVHYHDAAIAARIPNLWPTTGSYGGHHPTPCCPTAESRCPKHWTAARSTTPTTSSTWDTGSPTTTGTSPAWSSPPWSPRPAQPCWMSEASTRSSAASGGAWRTPTSERA